MELDFQAWQGQRDSWGGRNLSLGRRGGNWKFLVLLQWSSYIIVNIDLILYLSQISCKPWKRWHKNVVYTSENKSVQLARTSCRAQVFLFVRVTNKRGRRHQSPKYIMACVTKSRRSWYYSDWANYSFRCWYITLIFSPRDSINFYSPYTYFEMFAIINILIISSTIDA